MNTEPSSSKNEETPSSNSPYLERQAKIITLLKESGFQALALNPGPSLVYLTGLKFHLMERPIVALFIPDSPLRLIIPELEARKADTLPFENQVYPYSDDPATWQEAFNKAFDSNELQNGKVGVEPGRLRLLELRFFEAAARTARFISAEDPLSELRLYKTNAELSAMRRAVDIAQRALLTTLDSVKVGMTERELANELTVQLLRHGSNPELPFFPIVSAGPNSANPHASPTDRPLQSGDLLVIDWGANYEDYMSDITRTFAIGEVEPELAYIARIVSESNEAGRAAAQPGSPAGSVDQAARAVIEASGYGAFFTHRTGHGLGMEGHEAPYIFSANDIPLAPGMTFTVEPGIYLPNQGGVRIEDDILITESGSESLTDLSRNLKIIGV